MSKFLVLMIPLTLALSAQSSAAKDAKTEFHLACPDGIGKARITRMKIEVTSGNVASLYGLPEGWSISIENEPSQHAIIEGSMLIGSAALDCHSIGTVNFVVRRVEFGDLKFDMSGSLTGTKDFSEEKEYKLSPRDIVRGDHLRKK